MYKSKQAAQTLVQAGICTCMHAHTQTRARIEVQASTAEGTLAQMQTHTCTHRHAGTRDTLIIKV